MPDQPDQPDPIADPQAETLPSEVELTIPELLAFAMRMHREDRLDAAEKCYRSILEADPGNANAMHYLGVLLRQRGKGAEATDLIRQSIAIDPLVGPWHNNLGNVLLDEGQYDEAAAAYARCSELDPDNLEVLNNLGVLLRHLHRPQEAEAMLKRAIARNPGFVDAHANLASLCTSLGRMPEAFSHFADALALRPADVNTRRLLAIAYGWAGRLAEGQAACLDWLKLAPNDAQALHYLAAFGGADIPERASDRYVEQEFDGFANSFDARLADLNYRAPELVAEAVARLLGDERGQRQVLDVGCGTGLCGPHLRPFARRLVGVDLSAGMLDRARQRGLYDELVKAELVAYLEACEVAQDLVVSADTLCYFGRLDAAFAAVHRSLRAGGHWVFTVEAHPLDADFKLQPHGRYSHARGYVASALVRAGFGAVDLREVVLRSESLKPVAGWLVSATR